MNKLDRDLIDHACRQLTHVAERNVRDGMGPASAARAAIRETKALFPHDWHLAVQGDDDEDQVEVWEVEHKRSTPCASISRDPKPVRRRSKQPAHAKKRAYDINPSSPEVIAAFMKSGYPATEDGIQEFISERYGDWMRQLKRRYPGIDASQEWDTIIREFTAALERHFKFEDTAHATKKVSARVGDIDTTTTLEHKFRARPRDALTLIEKARQARGAAARWSKRSSALAREGQFREADDAQTEASALGHMASKLEDEAANLRSRGR